MPKPPLRKPKKKQNPLTAAKIDYIDYKDTALLRKFISDRGKIRARRVTGVSSQQQREIAQQHGADVAIADALVVLCRCQRQGARTVDHDVVADLLSAQPAFEHHLRTGGTERAAGFLISMGVFNANLLLFF